MGEVGIYTLFGVTWVAFGLLCMFTTYKRLMYPLTRRDKVEATMLGVILGYFAFILLGVAVIVDLLED